MPSELGVPPATVDGDIVPQYARHADVVEALVRNSAISRGAFSMSRLAAMLEPPQLLWDDPPEQERAAGAASVSAGPRAPASLSRANDDARHWSWR
jgi:hypothetical protein